MCSQLSTSFVLETFIHSKEKVRSSRRVAECSLADVRRRADAVLCSSAHDAAVDRAPDQTVQQQPGGLRGLIPTHRLTSAAEGPSSDEENDCLVFVVVVFSVVFGSDGRRQLVADADPHKMPQSDRATGELSIRLDYNRNYLI